MKIIRPYHFLMLISLILLAGCSEQDQARQTTTQTMPTNTVQQNKQTLSTQLELPKSGDEIAIITTDLGIIKFKLFTQGVPELTKNFKSLATEGKYASVPFHRVVKNFMIQTGDFTKKNGTGGYSYKGPGQYLANEINPAYKHLYGTVSMAKTGAPVSIGSQFFIVTNKEGTPFLDGSYSPIGQVYEGMEIAEKIADLQVPCVSDASSGIACSEKPSKIINIKKVMIENF